MKILVLKVQTIGDTLLVSPLISNLYRHYGKPSIDVFINEGTFEMLSLNPNVNNLYTYKRESQRRYTVLQRLKKNITLLRKIRAEKYDLLIDLDDGDRGAFISLFSNAKMKLGSGLTKSNFLKKSYDLFFFKDSSLHTIEKCLSPLNILNIEPIDKNVRIYWEKKDEIAINKKLLDVRPFVHIHPFSSGKHKDLDPRIWPKIIDFLHEKLALNTVLTCSGDQFEVTRLKTIASKAKYKPKCFFGTLTLKQVAVLNKNAQFFLGVDTAVMHISAANNIPTIAFFGPTNVANWGPWDNDLGKSFYIKGGGIQKNGKHIVISNRKPCIPCNQYGCSNNFESDCLLQLDIKEIKEIIQDFRQ